MTTTTEAGAAFTMPTPAPNEPMDQYLHRYFQAMTDHYNATVAALVTGPAPTIEQQLRRAGVIGGPLAAEATTPQPEPAPEPTQCPSLWPEAPAGTTVRCIIGAGHQDPFHSDGTGRWW